MAKNQGVVKRLEEALLSTGMMNEQFIGWIKAGVIDKDYIDLAFANFRQAVNPQPHKVLDEYVLGFVFDHSAKKVLLVWKNKPDWQAGKLNGIGGKIEAGETPLQAMEREFQEETGFIASYELVKDESGFEISGPPLTPIWQPVGTIGREALVDKQRGSFIVHVFAAKFWTEDCDVAMRPYLEDTGLVQNRLVEVANYRYLDTPSFFEKSEPAKKDHKQARIEREEIINLPLNFEILRRRGVTGLSSIVDLSLQALVDNTDFTISHPILLEDLE